MRKKLLLVVLVLSGCRDAAPPLAPGPPPVLSRFEISQFKVTEVENLSGYLYSPELTISEVSRLEGATITSLRFNARTSAGWMWLGTCLPNAQVSAGETLRSKDARADCQWFASTLQVTAVEVQVSFGHVNNTSSLSTQVTTAIDRKAAPVGGAELVVDEFSLPAGDAPLENVVPVLKLREITGAAGARISRIDFSLPNGKSFDIPGSCITHPDVAPGGTWNYDAVYYYCRPVEVIVVTTQLNAAILYTDTTGKGHVLRATATR